MPRDASGTYVLPLADVIGGTIIESTWANTTMGDLQAAMTDSLSRSGNGGMQAALLAINGNVGSPSLGFANDPISGLYLSTAGEVRMAASAIDAMRWTNNLVEIWNETDSTWYELLTTRDGFSLNESVTLTNGQLVVPFIKDISKSSFYIYGPDADNGLLDATAYTIDTDNQITLAESYAAGTLVTAANSLESPVFNAFLPLDGGTLTGNLNMSANVNMGDNRNIHIGTGNDWQLSFDGTNCNLRGNAIDSLWNLIGRDSGDSPSTMITADPNAAITLYYDGAFKFATSAEGAAVMDGTAGAPSWSFINDPNTGIYRQAENVLAISTGAVDKIVVASSQITMSTNLQIDSTLMRLNNDGNTKSISILDPSIGGIALQQTGGGTMRLSQSGTTGNTEKNWFIFQRDGGVEIYYNGTNTLETTVSGIDVTGEVVVENSGGVITLTHTGAIGRLKNDDGNMQLWNTSLGDMFQMFGTTTGGGGVDVFRGLPDGAVELYFNGGKKIETTVEGMKATGSISAVETTAIQLEINAYNSNGGVQTLVTTSGAAVIAQVDGSGNLEATWVTYLRNGAVQLNHNNIKKFETTSTGTLVQGNGLFQSTSAIQTSTAIYNSVGGVKTQVEVAGHVNISETDAGGNTIQHWMTLDKAAGVNLKYNGTTTLETTSTGITVSGDIKTDKTGTSAVINQLVNDDGGAVFRTLSGAAQMYTTDNAGGAYQAVMTGNRSGGTTIHFNGLAKVSTTEAGALITGSANIAPLSITSTTPLCMINLTDSASGSVNYIGANGDEITIRPAGTQTYVFGAAGSITLVPFTATAGMNLTLPTSAGGLSAGDLWNNSGVVNIV